MLLFSREMGAFYLLAVVLYHAVKNRGHLSWRGFKRSFMFLGVVGFVSFSLFWIYDAKYKPPLGTVQNIFVNQNIVMNGTVPLTTITTTGTLIQPIDVIDNPIKHLMFILKYHVIGGGLQISEPYQPWHLAWNWILPVEPFNAPIYFSMVRHTTKVIPLIVYTSIGTLPIWYSVWFVVPVTVLALLKKQDSGLGFFTLLLFWANYVPWLILSLTVHKIGFNYYFIYSLPALTLAIPFAWSKLPVSDDTKKVLIGLHLLASVVFFLWYFPVRVLNY